MVDGSVPLVSVSAAVSAGVDWLQVRDRSLDGNALLARVDALGAEARAAAERCGRSIRILVNRRLDIALAAGACLGAGCSSDSDSTDKTNSAEATSQSGGEQSTAESEETDQENSGASENPRRPGGGGEPL